MITKIKDWKKLNEGRGNTVIRYDGVNYPTYYISYYTNDEEEVDYDLHDTFMDDVKSNIAGFQTVKLEELSKPERLDNESLIYFENDIIKVVFSDNEWSLAVACIPVYTINDIGDETYDEAAFKEESNKFFKELLTYYSLRKPNGPWMSSDVTSIEEKKKMSKAARKFISDKIKFLVDKEGKEQKQAVAMAYSYAKKEGLLESYYSDQLNSVNGWDEYGLQFQFRGSGKQTKWLNLNEESANELVQWLRQHYNIDE